jgi:hypothetical protein
VADGERFELEIKLPTGTPETVDSAFLCRYAGALLKLLARVAKEDGSELTFTGLRLEEGCVRALVLPNDPDVAKAAADEAAPYVSGDAEPPPGIEADARAVSDILREKLSPGEISNIIVGPWKTDFKPRPQTARALISELISIRAGVIRVGGVKPAVRFEAPSEESAFTLLLSNPDDAPALGALLYQPIDIVATVRRNEEDRVVGGTLDEWEALEPGSGVEAWREWFRRSAPEWEDVEDVNRELNRTRDEDGAADDRH